MFELRQEFFKGLEGEKIELSLKATSLDKLFQEYDKRIEKLKSQGDIYTLGALEKDGPMARLEIVLNPGRDLESTYRIGHALGPIMEILLDNGLRAYGYLYNRKRGAGGIRESQFGLVFNMGDSVEPGLVKATVALVYSVFYKPSIFKVLERDFGLMDEAIVAGGYNSASFNGLEGYYFSRYFVKWLIDLRSLVFEQAPENYKYLEGLEAYVDKLENPLDKGAALAEKLSQKQVWEENRLGH